ncbi:MAG: phosphoribosylanthranilate isomerase [Prevotella sp.]|jgi:phosphoribosylanthranilate isomerase|nr:phosphoribosylanthranilate isomerase [Prevotella sp.]
MIIKVCGMRDADNIREVSELDIDMMGFIFWKDSPRFVRMISSHAGIIPDYSEERLNKNSGKVVDDQHRIKRVGVFVDDMPQTIVTRIYNYELDYVQLHGEESCIMIDNLRRTLEPDIRTGVKIIKTISVSSAEDIEKTKEYEGCVDLFLFDTKCPTMGGSGDKFDWSVLSAYKGNVPFLLSGGIGMDDVDKIKSFQHPQFAGVDVNSCFETEPGVKDVEKLRLFIEKLRHE